jgi:hypothetical protein
LLLVGRCRLQRQNMIITIVPLCGIAISNGDNLNCSHPASQSPPG